MKGSIRWRNGAWRLQASHLDLTGKKRFVTRTVKAPNTERGRRTAEKALRSLVAEVMTGAAHQTAESGTVGELLERWRTAREPDWSPSTVLNQRSIVKRIDEHLGGTRLDRLTPAAIDHFYAELRNGVAGDGGEAKPMAASTVRRVHAVLRSALQQAVKWDLIVTNPADRATPPKVRVAQVTTPEPELVARLLEAIPDESPFLAYVRLAAATGARRGEVCAVRWTDIDFDTGRVTIARSVAVGPGGAVEKAPKYGRGRVVTVDATTVDVVRAHRTRCVAAALAAGVELPSDAFLFSSDLDGSRPWNPRTANRLWDDLRTTAGRSDRERAEMAKIRLHAVRHFNATQLLGAGIPVRDVAERLGHANPSMTLGVYGHALPARDAEAADIMGGLLDVGAEEAG